MTTIFKHILSKYPEKNQKDLIPILQDFQNDYGFISEETIRVVSDYLKLSQIEIYSIATFYNQFKFIVPAKHTIKVCNGSACFLLGSESILESIIRKLDILDNMRSRDGLICVETVPCLGACGLAPLIQIDGKFYTKLNSEKLNEILDNLSQEIKR